MKKQLFVLMIVLGLGGVILIAGPWENFPPQKQSLTVGFACVDEIEMKDVNPSDGMGFIDSCYVEFLVNENGIGRRDTTGIAELSMGSRMFSFQIAGEDVAAGLEVDSLQVIFEVYNPRPQIATFSAFGGTPGAGSSIHTIPEIREKGLNYSLDMKMKSVNQNGKDQYVVPGNLVVVIITIDPSEIPTITPKSASYKQKGEDKWVEIYHSDTLKNPHLPNKDIL